MFSIRTEAQRRRSPFQLSSFAAAGREMFRSPEEWLCKCALDISPEEASFARRGFRGGEAGVRRRLEQAGRVFLQGYRATLEADEPEALATRLDAVESEFRGFAFEG